MTDNEENLSVENQEKVQQIKTLRENVNWESKEDRCEFLRLLFPLICSWRGDDYPNFRDIFRPTEIDRLLLDSIKYWFGRRNKYQGESFVEFVILAGYRDEPELDQNGKPLLLRTTALHQATKRYCNSTSPGLWNSRRVEDLFEIYYRRDVNYTDEETGLTHFHVACAFACEAVVKAFLDLGQDPDCLVTRTGESPLHLALKYNQIEVIELLLRRGADPDLANAEGSTPLHVISEKFRYIGTSKKFFEISEEINRPVRIDAKDKKGRTPLQCAVERLIPEIVELLLDRGADLSSFVFPAKSDFTERLMKRRDKNFKLRLASGLVGVVECLEKRGYQLDRRDAQMIMQFFAKFQLFEKSATFAETWYNDEEFVKELKGTEIRRGLSLYEVIQLRPEEAAKLLSGMDYFRLANTTVFLMELGHACSLHLCEKLSRRFFQRWALEPFWVQLINRCLPLECCDMIVEKLTNKDLRCICVAAKGHSS